MWMVKVPNSEAWRRSSTHTTEHVPVQVNVEQTAVSVLESLLHFDRLQSHSAKFSGQAGIPIASQFQGFYEVSRTMFTLLPSFILFLTVFLLYESQVHQKDVKTGLFKTTG